jgi:hypothetical protein
MSDSANEDAALQVEIAEREGFEARFPPEAFGGIAVAMGLLPEPGVLSGLQRSLLHPFYSFYVIGSGESLSREQWICGLAEMRDAARALLKSLRFDLALATVASLAEDPIFDPQFRTTIRSVERKADARLVELRSKQDKPGRPKKDEFWEELLPDLVRTSESLRMAVEKSATVAAG